MSNAYDVKLRKLTKTVARDLGYNSFIREGVYTMLGGPSFESIAEGRMLRLLGGDAAGECVAVSLILL